LNFLSFFFFIFSANVLTGFFFSFLPFFLLDFLVVFSPSLASASFSPSLADFSLVGLDSSGTPSDGSSAAPSGASGYSLTYFSSMTFGLLCAFLFLDLALLIEPSWVTILSDLTFSDSSVL
jgi:hypothetical protein